MYSSKKISCLTTVIILLCGLLFFYLKFRNTNQLKEIANSKNLKNGDLILRAGKSTESYLVHLADNSSEFTHIGIIIIERNQPYVIHAVPHKNHTLKKDLLGDFLDPKKTSSYAIYRSNYTSITLNKVVNEAKNFYVNKYTFDNEYNLNTDTKLYCSELILKAFNNVGIHLNVNAKSFNFVIGEHDIIFPSEFTKIPQFSKII
ncbi:hypothetical protein MHL31_05365 [Lutibacter sp. A80]|uniref:YiiX/YebB-like N1pC/P60 family cysteine hydrolase n=1 Tax=Lutibacter sp. A80 TaxID=2918453 RepID=UPI001F05B29C|nr:YiiX/YebB-like N1pC/P60 family cysteine hydrolase [Lutibacter sp. A80]UMB61633.1 hypothetical protein MHL31_05365 [Lutibacter sp. A80]